MWNYNDKSSFLCKQCINSWNTAPFAKDMLFTRWQQVYFFRTWQQALLQSQTAAALGSVELPARPSQPMCQVHKDLTQYWPMLSSTVIILSDIVESVILLNDEARLITGMRCLRRRRRWLKCENSLVLPVVVDTLRPTDMQQTDLSSAKNPTFKCF